jgi:pSer/pThr/pTyr-binding forkhead associated (FHA) protein
MSVAGWILKSTDPEMTIRLPESGIRTIGRSARAEFIVEAALVSRLHCRLTTEESGTLLVEDLESTNGIFVNGAKVDKSDLVAGDILSVGRVDFSVSRS